MPMICNNSINLLYQMTDLAHVGLLFHYVLVSSIFVFMG